MLTKRPPDMAVKRLRLLGFSKAAGVQTTLKTMSARPRRVSRPPRLRSRPGRRPTAGSETVRFNRVGRALSPPVFPIHCAGHCTASPRPSVCPRGARASSVFERCPQKRATGAEAQ